MTCSACQKVSALAIVGTLVVGSLALVSGGVFNESHSVPTVNGTVKAAPQISQPAEIGNTATTTRDWQEVGGSVVRRR